MKAGRFRIHITRVGWLFIALCLGIGAAGLNTGNNLLYLIFGMMCSFIILSGVLSNNTLSYLTIVPHFPPRIFAKQMLPVHIDLVNRKRWFPSFALLLSPASPDIEAPDKAFVLKLPVQKSESVTNHVRFPKRGHTKLPAYEVQTSYPFGLIKKYILVPSEESMVVYPAIVPIDAWLALDHRLHGEFLSNLKGDSSHPYGIRAYVYGDSARFIHWKTSAKRGVKMLKEFEKEKRMKIVLDVVLAARVESDPDLLERALSAAASVLMSLKARGFEMTMRINGDRVETHGKGYLDAYLTALALADPPPESKEQFLGNLRGDEAGVVVSDLPESRLKSTGLLTIGREQLGLL